MFSEKKNKQDFEPSPKFSGAKFFGQLTNISEYLAFFCGGTAAVFLARIYPPLTMLIVAAYALIIFYLVQTRGNNPPAPLLRGTALLVSIPFAVWDFAWLWVSVYPLKAVAVLLGVSLLLIGAVWLWVEFSRTGARR